MDFKDTLKQLTERVITLKEQIKTEEATKNAFIMPFIQMLGYDVFNPLEVAPEMDCDLIKKKGEKIDYAIIKENEPIMLIECKHWKQNLTLHDNQLKKYFVASKAKFGVLTNGIIYRFYTDLVKSNIMDDAPFLEINLENLKENQIEEVKKFHKSYFDIDTILSSASELKYTSEMKVLIEKEFSDPSPEFVKVFAKQVYDGVITPRLLEQFTELLKKSFSNHINDIISERLNLAIKKSDQPQNSKTEETTETPNKNKESKIITTKEELEGYYIVKSILRNIVPSESITYRDAQSYFAILFKDNNRKTICRLFLDSKTHKQLIILDENKKEIKYRIENIDDIYKYSKELIESVKKYIKPTEEQTK